MKQLPKFQAHNAVRKDILRHMKKLLAADSNTEHNPILSLFDSSTIQMLGGFETRWMPDNTLSQFLLPDANPEMIHYQYEIKDSLSVITNQCSYFYTNNCRTS